MSLLETDPDVVDYLLRRKASQSPDLLQPEEPFALSERHSSSDSNKASSGEVSPYDNNSPVLSERRGEPGSPASEQLYRVPEQYSLVGQTGAVTWGYKGSHSNMSEGSSRSSQEGLDGLHSDSRHQTAVQRTQTTPDISECRLHPPVTRVCTNPHADKGRPRLQLNINPPVTSQRGHGVNSTLRPQAGVNTGEGGPLEGRSPPPYNAHHRLASSQSTPQLATAQQPHRRSSAGQSNSASTTEAPVVSQSPEWQEWQRDRWQIWQLLSSDNADTLPETLV